MLKNKTPISAELHLPPINYNDSWQYALIHYTQELVEYFVPKIANNIDWNKKFRFLQQELTKLEIKDSIKRVDSLLEFTTLSGDPLILLLHIEIQSTKPETIAHRMFEYLVRLFKLYPNVTIENLIIYVGPENYKNMHIFKPFKHNNNLKVVCHYFMLAKHSEAKLLAKKSLFSYILLLNKWINTLKKSGSGRLKAIRKFINLIQDAGFDEKDYKFFIKFSKFLVTLPQDIEHERDNIIQPKNKNMFSVNLEYDKLVEIRQSFDLMTDTGKSIDDFKKESKLEGEQIGIQKGKLETQTEGIIKALKLKLLSIDQISQLFEVPTDFILNIKNSLEL